MGAVVSCIADALRAIGRAIMAVISAIGRAITAVVNGIVDFLMIIVSCLTCNRAGRGRTRSHRRHGGMATTSRI
ncbi:hypothetical protein TWF696_004462 [Orbilia brochopaga]|uniref:Uncharacterized protein n=1 Tax=Orbilia brochopaga TaxID=3140254 RepID=A0AAV9V6E0_9PEZI